MFEKLEDLIAAAAASLLNNSEHRPSLANALTEANNCMQALEKRVAQIESVLAAGSAGIAALDSVAGAAQANAAGTGAQPGA